MTIKPYTQSITLYAILLLIAIVPSAAQDCPSIAAIMVDACGIEQRNEFVIVNSGGGFNVSDFQFTFNPTNTGGATNKNVNIGFDSCGLTAGNETLYSGCANVFSAGPGDVIPPNSYVVFQTSGNADETYDFSSLCEDDKCIYVISNACTRTMGAFTNKPGASGPRQNFLSIAGTSCVDEATYDTVNLISNSDGNYFMPPNSYGVDLPDRCTAPPVPELPSPLPNFDFETTLCITESSAFSLPNSSTEGIQGTWTPSFDPSQTQTYTFIPNSGECARTTDILITIEGAETPSFNLPAQLCLGETLTLPGNSIEGFSGNWSPEFNSNQTEIYTFTPDDNQCVSEIQFEIAIIEELLPSFNVPSTLCEGASFELPQVSLNGIQGSWTPDFNNQNTTSYTFTPNANACASNLQLDIEIIPKLIPEFDIPEDLCAIDLYNLATTSLNGIEGSWSPQNQVAQSGTYTFTPTGSVCAEAVTFQIEVVAEEVPAFDLPSSVCVNGFVEFPEVSLNGYQGTWSPEFSTDQETTYTFTPLAGQCTSQTYSTSIAVLAIEFNDNLAPLEACDDQNNRFFANFDLTAIIETVTFNNADLEVSFHVSQNEADNNLNPIQSPYTNEIPEQQTIFVRIENPETTCVQTTTLDLIVFNTPLLNPINPIAACDDAENGSQFFDLTQVAANLLVSGQDTTDFIVSYHLSEAGANANSDTISNPEAFQNTTNPQLLFVRVTDLSSPLNCYDIATVELLVTALPPINPPMDFTVCADSESASFNLGQKIAEITNNDDSLSVFFYESATDQANNNPISNFENYQNTSNPQVLQISVVSPDSDCIASTSLDLVVTALPTIAQPEPLVACATDNEGFSEFDLLAVVATLLNAEDQLQITVHETEVDAVNGENALVIEDENGAAIPFQNTVAFNQTLYLSVHYNPSNDSDCFSVIPLELRVVESPRIQALQDLVRCDDNNLDGFASFNLTQNTALAIGSQGAENLMVSYHETQADAASGSNPIANPSNYTNNSNPQTIYLHLFDTETGCVNQLDAALPNHFTISVEAYPNLNSPTPLEACNTGANPSLSFPTAVFDLTSKQEEITGLSPVPDTIRFTYYETEANMVSQENPIDEPSAYINSANAPMLIYFEAVNTASQNECSNTGTLNLVVLPLPTPEELTQEQVRLTGCDEDGDGVAATPFDLTQIGALIVGSGNYGIRYYLSDLAALNEDSSEEIINPEAYTNDPTYNELDENLMLTNRQLIWLRLESNNPNNPCFSIVSMEIVVQPRPELNPLGSPFAYAQCESNPTQLPAPEDLAFNLYAAVNGSPSEIIAILDPANEAQDQMDYDYSFHLSEADAEAGLNPIAAAYEATNGQILYLRVTNRNTQCYNSGNIAQVIIIIEPAPAITTSNLSPMVVCADEQMHEDPEGIATIDLSQRDAEIDPNFNNPDGSTSVTYYASEEDFINGIAIQDPTRFTTSQSPTLILAQVLDINTLCASLSIQQFEIEIIPRPTVDLSPWDGTFICIDTASGALIPTEVAPVVLDTQLSEAVYSFEWTLNGAAIAFSGSALSPTQAGLYSVTVSDLNNLIHCEATSSVEILESNPPQFEINILSAAFDGSHSIEVINIQGVGPYEFSIDNGPWESLSPGASSLIFTGLTAGVKTVRGRARSGCGELTIQITLIDYPLFFTPNEDGYKDTWNIIGLSDQYNAKIYIFNRYGKLLKQISPSGSGWDGTYNGKNMPTSDYWFRIEYQDPATGVRKEFKSHFTLKR